MRKAFRRNHLEFEKLPPARYPVFGTIASRFSDAGVNVAVFAHLCSLKASPQKRVALANEYSVGDLQAFTIIVPRSA